MAIPTPAEAAARWSQNLGSAGPRIQAGVQAVTASPGAAAARQADVWAANTQAAKSKFARKAAAVSTSEWQQATIEKGLPRIAQGAQAAQSKVEAFQAKFLPHVASVVASLPPRGNMEANLQRMVANARGMAKFNG